MFFFALKHKRYSARRVQQRRCLHIDAHQLPLRLAVAAAEFLQAKFPDRTGFSPRNVRRMRDFYRTYENDEPLLRLAMKIGWTLNVVIMEAELTRDARRWYLEQVREQQWAKKA